MNPRRPRLQLLLIALLALASLVTLLSTRPALTGAVWSNGDDLTLAVAWVVAVAAALWLFLATGACVVALQVARPLVARRLAPALPFGIRRLVEVAIVTSCIALPTLPAHALGPARSKPVVVEQPVVRAPAADAPVVRAPTPPVIPVTPVAPAAPIPRPPTAPTAPAPAPSPPPAPASARHGQARVVVRTGDNLWLISRAALAQTSGRAPSDAEVARYWLIVIEANRSTLRSGNPSLVFPGELVTLPAPTAVS